MQKVFDVPAGSVVYGVTWDWLKLRHILLWRDPSGKMQSSVIEVKAS